ncbi:phenylacetate--CoA ligase family protein [Elusimicrobiota bacterium]
MKFEKLPLDEQKKIQWQNFQDIFKYCRESIPYYKEKYQNINSDIKDFYDLNRVPILTKKDIEKNYPDRITMQTDDKADWEHHATGGTTDRLICVSNKDLRYHIYARGLRTMNIAGKCYPGRKRMVIPADVCSITCGSRKSEKEMLWDDLMSVISDKPKILKNFYSFIKKNQWRLLSMMIFREKELPSFGPDGTGLEDEKLEYYIREISRYEPYLLRGLPTYLHMLAHFIEDNNFELPKINVIKPMGSSASPGIKAFLGNVFKCDVFEDYGSHEFGNIASECEAHAGDHIAMSEFIVEIVRGDRHAKEGKLGNIIITDLKNRVMPFIRYQIGDVGRFYKTKCTCGRESIRVTVEGRLQDLIITNDGKEYTSDHFRDFFLNYEGVRYFQLIQETREKIQVLIVQDKNKKFNKNDLMKILKSIFGEIQIRINIVKRIQPEASGKFRFVKSCSYMDLMNNQIR